MWKKLLLGILAFIVAIVLLVMYATSGMTDTTEAFFESVATKNYNRAYNYLSDDFTKATSKEQLIAFMESNGFDKYRSASWGNRVVEGKRGTIEGTIETETDGAIPVKIKLVKLSDESWRIYAIEKPQSGIQIEADTKISELEVNKSKLLSVPETLALVKNTILHFALSVNKKDMSYLRDDASELFKKEVSLEDANLGFKSFMDMDVDFTMLDKMQPIIDTKTLQEDGNLLVKGYYETSPNKFYFQMLYTKENGLWKLIAIDAKIN